MKMATPAGRRYLRRFFPTMIAYVLVLFACVWAIKHWEPKGIELIILSVLPALPIIAAIVVMGLYLVEETDEFLRQRIASCMLFGTGVLLAAATVYGFLVNGGAIKVGRTHFEFDDENNGPADYHHIDAATHARNVEF